MAERGNAYVTLLLNDAYLKGALTLGYSLRDVGAAYELVVLVTESVSEAALASLTKVYDEIICIDPITNPQTENLNLLGRLDLRDSFTKIGLWRQVQYAKIVYLDADAVVLQNIDHLFDLDVPFAAAPDIGWPDIFNSGVFFTKPDIGTFAALRRLCDGGVTFDGGDQGLLNQYFHNFHRLSFTYNVTPSAGYQYLPAFRHFQSQVKVAHFIGAEKPWQRKPSQFDGPYHALLSHWWAVYDRHDVGSLDPGYIPPAHKFRGTGLRRMQSIDERDEPFEAPSDAWDARSSAPPKDHRPQANLLRVLGGANVWDSQSGASQQYVPQPLHSPRMPKSVHFEPPAPTSTAAPVFPWEQKQKSAERVFPEDAIAPLREIIEIEPRPPTPESVREVSRAPLPMSSASGAGAGVGAAHPPQAERSFSYDYASAAQADAGGFDSSKYMNAWDQMAIQDYVRSMPNRPRAPSSIWGDGSYTPREPETPEGFAHSAAALGGVSGGAQLGDVGGEEAFRQAADARSLNKTFQLSAAPGVPEPQQWDPAQSLANLASNANDLARRAAASAGATLATEPQPVTATATTTATAQAQAQGQAQRQVHGQGQASARSSRGNSLTEISPKSVHAETMDDAQLASTEPDAAAATAAEVVERPGSSQVQSSFATRDV